MTRSALYESDETNEIEAAIMKTVLWWVLKGYGEAVCRLRGNNAGYYWSLRAMCNWAGRDWYGRPTAPAFTSVGWIKF